MTTRFFDLQEPDNPSNGCVVADARELRRLLASFRDRAPCFIELVGDQLTLLLGLAATEGCAQVSTTGGELPYWMALEAAPDDASPEMSFLITNTRTDIAGRYRLAIDTLVEIAEVFVRRGERDDRVRWEVI
ncbi:MAG: Imm1 family immunity protein [Myxococcota bacterium]|nr:Imm1 family immunity protein [Myxococcota bacterium]